jgi:hypothetical protein
MAVPTIQVLLTPGGNNAAIDITAQLSQETNATLSSLIEDPTGLNNFTAGDLSFKGYDLPNGTTVSGYFANIQPTSVDYLVLVILTLVPPGGTTPVTDTYFDGFVAPNTLQFEPRTGAFSFTVISKARNLQTTSAVAMFQRPGYPTFPTSGFVAGYDHKWNLYSGVSSINVPIYPPIQVSLNAGGGQSTPDFFAGDQIQIDTNETFTIVSVTPDSASSPPNFWELGLSAPPTKDYNAGMFIHLLTPYQRNLALHDVVSQLFAAAGFGGEQYFFSAALPNLAALFLSPMNVAGLTGGTGVGIAAAAEIGGTQIGISNANGTFLAASASSGFTLLSTGAGFTQPLIDATDVGTTHTIWGPKRTRVRASAPRFGLNVTMKFYGYDQFNGNQRYVYTVTCNADVAPGTPLTITTELATETCTVGVWVWGGYSVIGGVGINTTTSTDLSALYDAIGVAVDPATGTVFFTDIQLIGAAGTPVTMNTSSYQPGGAGYVANRVTGINGPIVFTGNSRCVVFQLDGILGAGPTSSTWTVNAAGVMTEWFTAAQSPYLMPLTLKRNAGDGRWYALISDPQQGVLLASWYSDFLAPDTSRPPVQIAPPSNMPAQAAPLSSGRKSFDVDLAVQYGVSNGYGQPCPMFALIGGTPVFISNAGSGFVPYADMTGFSVADALQELSITIAGVFYLVQVGPYIQFPAGNLRGFYQWSFRSRSAPKSGLTIGFPTNPSNDQIDGDAGFMTVTTQSVFNLWIGYVSITNENDQTIFGDTSNVPGSIAYASANTPSGQSSYSLELSSRFVTSSAFATALANSLYNYLGAKKRWIEVNRSRDGRSYQIGSTFHCQVDGLNRQFQITEVDVPMNDLMVKVVGFEV